MGERNFLNFCTLFVAVVIIQSLHMVEHIAQVIQKFWLGWEEAHGLITVLDFEWVHFVYNGVLFFMLSVLLFTYSYFLRRRGTALFSAFSAGTALQGFHMILHTGSLIQYLQRGFTHGIQDPSSILRHFLLNIAVLTLIIIPFIGLRVYRCWLPVKKNLRL
ncbi:hypothetical protein MYX07_05445 [Patescibacteria group bacterium AH-259-L07]|nr:hypothetical protein [Patescibacteria group bacterium AH-259-L07]